VNEKMCCIVLKVGKSNKPNSLDSMREFIHHSKPPLTQHFCPVVMFSFSLTIPLELIIQLPTREGNLCTQIVL